MTPADLEGAELVIDPRLRGHKSAVRCGKHLYVSPAMYALLTKEKGRARDRVIHKIGIIYRDPPGFRERKK
jgi:hypothetical protein